MPVSRHCCSVYTWVNLRQVGRLCVTCTPHIFPSCVSQWPQAMQPASHSTFVHGPGSHLCTMCTMVDPSLPSARPRDVGQSGISAPPHVHSYIAYAIKLTPLQVPYYVRTSTRMLIQVATGTMDSLPVLQADCSASWEVHAWACVRAPCLLHPQERRQSHAILPLHAHYTPVMPSRSCMYLSPCHPRR